MSWFTSWRSLDIFCRKEVSTSPMVRGEGSRLHWVLEECSASASLAPKYISHICIPYISLSPGNGHNNRVSGYASIDVSSRLCSAAHICEKKVQMVHFLMTNFKAQGMRVNFSFLSSVLRSKSREIRGAVGCICVVWIS